MVISLKDIKTVKDSESMRVLLVEDDNVLADAIQTALQQAGYRIERTNNGLEAEAFLEGLKYDLVILDLGLPDKDGLAILKDLRASKNHIPVLLLTARDTLEDRVSGLDSGADDYLTKPFKLKELEARVRALIRRRHLLYESEVSLGSLKFDLEARRVFVDGKEIDLSARELDLLELFLKQSGKVLSKTHLIEYLCSWHDDITENAIEVYISRLRKKLESTDIRIKTIRGIGYILEAINGS